jgi:hypothetical protein
VGQPHRQPALAESARAAADGVDGSAEASIGENGAPSEAAQCGDDAGTLAERTGAREAVVDAVERAADGWGDTPERLAAQKAAAAAVLEHAVATGEAVGKSSSVVDELREQYPVTGQSEETWWRKNIRPVLKAVGDYSPGEHGYRVTNFDSEAHP